MSNDNEPLSMADLEQSNKELRLSLKKCQALVEECRNKLAAEGEESFVVTPRSHLMIKKD